ncbi:tyrosine recombinase [Burkholderia phage BcepMigl]|uniref:Integrase n=1 Tax=Burkholderia phage BcepMigl TaxID=2886899 RepID=I6X6P3_9CAUD|nr:tyrosine recombinase [Burkholderia phage BcepMigl]AFN39072.1 tyrosine recombinase [Burkholderia phage BcepMigl]
MGSAVGTITKRPRKDGFAYTAQIRLMRDGKQVHTEAKTFDRKAAAEAWMKRRETELSEPGALASAINPEPLLRDLIDRYLKELEEVKPVGRSKKSTLKAIGKRPLGALKPSQVDSQAIINYARARIADDEVSPATVMNDLVLLAGVFDVALPAWGVSLDPQEMEKAKAVCRKMGLIEKAEERTRVPTMDELEKLMVYFYDMARRRKWATPMVKIIAFAIFATRRQEEITAIRWDDLNEEESTQLVRDVKHPRKKIGNDQESRLTPEALAIIKSMPRTHDRIFPYTTDAISAQFTRACDWLEIEDLRFHDLRRAGVTRLFEMGWNIPDVAKVSLHRDWNMLRRYTNLKGKGDRYAGWKWTQIAIDQPVHPPRPKKKGEAVSATVAVAAPSPHPRAARRDTRQGRQGGRPSRTSANAPSARSAR